MKKRGKFQNLAKVIVLSLALSMTVQTVAPISTAIVAEAAAKKVKVSLNVTKKTIEVGESFTLKVKGTKKKVSFKSNKKSVATVTKKGEVTGISEGKAVILVKTEGRNFTCKVTVKENEVVANAPFEAVVAKVGDNSIAMPESWEQTKTNLNGIEAYIFMPKNADVEKGANITVTSTASQADNKDFDLYKDYIEEQLSADVIKEMFTNQSGKEVEIENFAITEEDITLGKVLVISYDVKVEGKVVLSQKIYDVFAEGYTTEFTVTDSGVATTPDVYEVVHYMMESLTFEK